MLLPEGKSLILFDGYCHLCSGLVQNILNRDTEGRFLFCSLDSELGKKLRLKYQIADSVDSILLIENNQAYVYADAVLGIAAALGGVYSILKLGHLLPKQWRNSIYRWFARNRYAWFGERKNCFLPDPSFKDRFL